MASSRAHRALSQRHHNQNVRAQNLPRPNQRGLGRRCALKHVAFPCGHSWVKLKSGGHGSCKVLGPCNCADPAVPFESRIQEFDSENEKCGLRNCRSNEVDVASMADAFRRFRILEATVRSNIENVKSWLSTNFSNDITANLRIDETAQQHFATIRKFLDTLKREIESCSESIKTPSDIEDYRAAFQALCTTGDQAYKWLQDTKRLVLRDAQQSRVASLYIAPHDRLSNHFEPNTATSGGPAMSQSQLQPRRGNYPAPHGSRAAHERLHRSAHRANAGKFFETPVSLPVIPEGPFERPIFPGIFEPPVQTVFPEHDAPMPSTAFAQQGIEQRGWAWQPLTWPLPWRPGWGPQYEWHDPPFPGPLLQGPPFQGPRFEYPASQVPPTQVPSREDIATAERRSRQLPPNWQVVIVEPARPQDAEMEPNSLFTMFGKGTKEDRIILRSIPEDVRDSIQRNALIFVRKRPSPFRGSEHEFIPSRPRQFVPGAAREAQGFEDGPADAQNFQSEHQPDQAYREPAIWLSSDEFSQMPRDLLSGLEYPYVPGT